jgi:peptidoglycan L-alanyl-D-glutamate endopeptidase CwlK
MAKFKFSERSIARFDGVHPKLVQVAVEALEMSPYDFGISQGVRTKEQQEALYAQGRTKAGPIVTWTLNSKHLKQSDGHGHAIDIAIYIKGKLTWDEHYYDAVAPYFKAAAKRIGVNLTWGGDWKRKDRPHYEINV